MEFKPETESNRHPVVNIAKDIGRALRLLIIGEYSKEYEEYLKQLPKPKKPRKTEYIHFAVISIHGEESPWMKEFLILHGAEYFERATWPQSNSPEDRTK